MSDRHARYAAATGIFFVVLVVIAFLVQPKPPPSDATPAEIIEYIKAHHEALHVIQVVFGIAGFFFLWFIGALRSLFGAAEGGEARLATTAFGGGLVAFATLVVGFGITAAAELHPARDPEITRALWDAGVLVFAVGAPAVAVFFVANSLSILRSGFLPSWMGWLGLITALFNALGIGAIFTDHGVFAADGALGFFIGFILFMVWVLLTSILIVRKLGGSEAPA
ncbi:MAG: hypothetical protein ACHQCF_06185 [Solirubrobacterales bacterium]